jgi:hypothetical protein
LNFGVDSNFRDATAITGNSFLGFIVGNNARWQENQVGYTNMNADLGESFRVKTRFGASTYGASDQFFASLGKAPEEQRDLRFANVGFASGSAALTRVEEDVFRFGEAKVTLFQQYSRVDPFFEDIKFSDKSLKKETKDDVFSNPNRETGAYGISLVQGSSGLLLSQSLISNISNSTTDFYREQRLESKAWFGLRDLSKDFLSSAALSAFVPTSVWIGYRQGAVSENSPGTPSAGTLTDTYAGASWQWGDIYTSLGAYRSSQWGLQPVVNLPNGWSVTGVNASVSLKKKNWEISGYVSLLRSSFQDGLTNFSSSNNSVNGGVSLSIPLEKWPDLKLAFDVSTYGDMSNYGGTSSNSFTYYPSYGIDAGRVTTAGIAFDFAKYLANPSTQKLQLFYYARQQKYDGLWALVPSQTSELDHVFGGSIRTRW